MRIREVIEALTALDDIEADLYVNQDTGIWPVNGIWRSEYTIPRTTESGIILPGFVWVIQ